jgi:hypothetical protein
MIVICLCHLDRDELIYSSIIFLYLLFPLYLRQFTAGFAGDDAPRSVFPSLIGRARQPGIMVSSIAFGVELFFMIKLYYCISFRRHS